jgi:hypothetical protein
LEERERLNFRSSVFYVAPWWKSLLIKCCYRHHQLVFTKYTSIKWMFPFLPWFVLSSTPDSNLSGHLPPTTLLAHHHYKVSKYYIGYLFKTDSFIRWPSIFWAYEHNTRKSNDHCKYANQFIIYSYLNHTCLSQVDDLNSTVVKVAKMVNVSCI